MPLQETQAYILDSIPYPIVFVDTEHVIRYMNRTARFQYGQMRGYGDLIGKSIFECHNDASKEKIMQAVEKLKNHGNEIFLGVGVNNQRIYINPVRDENGVLLGYFERFELNLQK
jgi:DUF438 domain-containing protein